MSKSYDNSDREVTNNRERPLSCLPGVHNAPFVADKLDYPDRMLLDFDSGENTPFAIVQSTVLRAKELLDSLGIISFAMTTGSRGIPIVILLRRIYTFDVRTVMQFVLTPGQRSDITQADILLGNMTNCYIIADRGYTSKDLRSRLIEQGCNPVIPPKSNCRAPYEYDKHIYKERHLIECFFLRLSTLDVFSRVSINLCIIFLHFFPL